jgi:hypothetical protein
MGDRGMPFPPINRSIFSVCVVQICDERIPIAGQK